jgi:uncharacterized membrane protein YbhN (UPF0104 family)
MGVLNQTGRFRLVNPVGDASRLRRLAKVAGWLFLAAAIVALLSSLGVDIGGWLSGLWKSINSVPPHYLIAAVGIQTAQTVLTSATWLFVLRAAYRDTYIHFAPVLAAYAVGTALNGVLPASLGTLVMLYLLVAAIPPATFPGLLAAAVVQKIAFATLSSLVYVYLFVSVPGSFSLELANLNKHPLLVGAAVVGGGAVIYLVGRLLWPKLRTRWQHAKQGGAILSSPREYLVRVALPSLGGYAAKLAGSAVFLAAFAIPVTFDSIMHVVGGNSIAGATAVTPGGAGVNEAVSVVALSHYADAQTATAFALEQHLVGTAWNIVVALILMPAVFGWKDAGAMFKAASAEARERRAAAHSHAA